MNTENKYRLQQTVPVQRCTGTVFLTGYPVGKAICMSPQMERAAGYILTCPSGGNCANMKAQQTAPAKAEKGRQKQEGNGQNMYVIAGLGNPKKEYDNTRHNIGFSVIDMLADKTGISVNTAKHKGLLGAGYLNGQKIILVKPLTYMNLSGECIREVLDYYKVDGSTNLIVIHDDISLEPGIIRVRKKGSAGGHNGLKNIIQHLGKDQFVRIKVGVGEKPAGYDLADYVLGHFDREEQVLMKQVSEEVCEAVQMILEKGPDAAMNVYNGRKVEKA
mgnify:FL=1